MQFSPRSVFLLVPNIFLNTLFSKTLRYINTDIHILIPSGSALKGMAEGYGTDNLCTFTIARVIWSTLSSSYCVRLIKFKNYTFIHRDNT
jgi:hypothetical protein